jgi:hypothetical protein
VADGEAQAIKLVNEAADLYFKGNAQLLRQLQTVETSLTNNSKIVVPTSSSLVNVIGALAGIDTHPPAAELLAQSGAARMTNKI